MILLSTGPFCYEAFLVPAKIFSLPLFLVTSLHTLPMDHSSLLEIDFSLNVVLVLVVFLFRFVST